MRALNAPYPDGNEVSPRVKWLTLRSDNFDKYAQPEGRFVGQPGWRPTSRSTRGIAGRDQHRPAARRSSRGCVRARRVRETFRSSSAPRRLASISRPKRRSCSTASSALSHTGADEYARWRKVTVYQVAGARERGCASRRTETIGGDGSWGPAGNASRATLEFVIEADGYPVTHVYRSAFRARSRLRLPVARSHRAASAPMT